MPTAKPLLRLVIRLAVGSVLVYSFVFLAFAVLPLDPARAVLGPLADTTAIDALRARYGFDRPLGERYVRVGAALLRGDFGVSITWGQPVASVLGRSLATTMGRLFAGLMLGLGLALVVSPLAVAKDLKALRTAWMAIASVPSFIALVLILSLFGTGLAFPPSEYRWLYEALAISWAAAYTASVVSLSLLDRLDFRHRRSRQADFLLHLRAPPAELVRILMRSAWATAFAAAANAATGALTALTFAEYVFGLPGFSIRFFRACEHGDLAVVAFGSLFLAWSLLVFQMCAEVGASWSDRRLRQS